MDLVEELVNVVGKKNVITNKAKSLGIPIMTIEQFKGHWQRTESILKTLKFMSKA